MNTMKIDSVESMQALLYTSPFTEFLGLKVDSLDLEAGRMVVSMPMKGALARMADAGQFHGGPIASLIDTAGACLVSGMIENGSPTINFRVDYIRPAGGSGLKATVVARRVGRSMAICDVDVVDDQDRLVAVGRGAFGATRAQ